MRNIQRLNNNKGLLIEPLLKSCRYLLINYLGLKLFESDFALNEHSSYAHGEDAKPIFECPTCKAEFKEEVALEDHINLIHSKEKKCSYCGKTFALIRYLNTHISKYHRDRSHVETIPCKLCDKMIVKGKQMKRHLKTCKGKVEKPLQLLKFANLHCYPQNRS